MKHNRNSSLIYAAAMALPLGFLPVSSHAQNYPNNHVLYSTHTSNNSSIVQQKAAPATPMNPSMGTSFNETISGSNTHTSPISMQSGYSHFLLAQSGAFGQGKSSPDALNWPSKPVKWVVPFPPGGPTDVVGRIITQKLQEEWGQQVIVENKPGAGTVIGTDAIAKSSPDGYTLGMVISAYFINPSLRKDLPYETPRSFTNITQLVSQHLVLVSNVNAPFTTVQNIIDHAKKNPGKTTYASPGTGTSTHLAAELLGIEAGIRMTHIPYKGSVPALTDLIAGRVDLMVDVYHSAKQHIESGKLRAIALTSANQPKHIRQYPLVSDVLPEFNVTSLFGLIASANTPKGIVDKIHADVSKTLNFPDVKGKLEGMGLEVIASTPEQFDAVVKSEIRKWERVIRENNIRLE